MDAEERRAAIRQLIEANGRIDVEEVSYQYGVSLRTARRDLDILSKRGLVKRTHGGAVAPLISGSTSWSDETDALPIFVRARRDRAYKNAIGKMAAALIPDEAHVILDAGTTALYVARHLSPRMTGTVLTNGLLTATELAPRQRLRLHLSGGTCRPETHSLVGPRAIDSFRGVHADICFVGTTGVHLRRGLTTSDLLEANIKKTMIQSAAKAVLVADYSKFGTVGLHRFAELRQIDTIVTDERIPPDEVTALQRLGLEVVIARLDQAPPTDRRE